jgi:endonuclease-3
MESLKKMRSRVGDIYDILDPLYTFEKTALKYKTPFQLLIATILSAQCTDKQVNTVTESLFQKYEKPGDYLSVEIPELEADVRSTGFYKNKTKSIRGCCEKLLELYEGKVPGTMQELLKLPGVGRKTANCVLGAVFDVPGIVVDTHVKRLSLKLGLTKNKNPDKIEKDVEKLLEKERWRRFSDLLIYHGRAVCSARKPKHGECVVARYCPSNTL